MKTWLLGKQGVFSRLLFLLSALLLVATFFLPLWRIQLWAPQYPEGLSLDIWINKFSGDVQTVNILNHYIGMAKIEESAFPELKIFPMAFGLFIAFGVLVAIVGRKALAALWTFAILIFSCWSMYDFYSWEYRFGRDLNPDAAIKMEDMIYQPPLIGEKVFLNITATSWPGWSGYAFIAAILLALIALAVEMRRGEVK